MLLENGKINGAYDHRRREKEFVPSVEAQLKQYVLGSRERRNPGKASLWPKAEPILKKMTDFELSLRNWMTLWQRLKIHWKWLA